MPVKYITNEISLSKVSYNKLEKVAEKVEGDLKAQKNGKLKNEYSKLNNSDSVVEICKNTLKNFIKTHINCGKKVILKKIIA